MYIIIIIVVVVVVVVVIVVVVVVVIIIIIIIIIIIKLNKSQCTILSATILKSEYCHFHFLPTALVCGPVTFT